MDLKSIHEIFTNRILRIPAYQRGFAWTNNKTVDINSKEPLKNIKGQLKDLWDDLINIPQGKWHYTGLLTLVETKPCDYSWLPNFKQYAIVDGQQRITSILILLSVLIEKAKEQNIVLGIREGDVEMHGLFLFGLIPPAHLNLRESSLQAGYVHPYHYLYLLRYN